MFDAVILTIYKYVNPKKTDWSDTDFDWTTTKYAIFLTTWDYFERFEEFSIWLENTKNKTTFINSTEIIRLEF